MQEAWNRIVAWCERYAPEVLAGLNPGATDAEIADAEAHLGVTFPDDLRELYRLHNGQSDDAPKLLLYCEWLRLQFVRDEWNNWNGTGIEDYVGEPQAGVKPHFWSNRWIPFTYDGSGNHHCIDLDPPEGGAVGQVIMFWHDDPARELVAPSLTAWIHQLADGLESGKMIYATGYERTIERSELDNSDKWRGVGDGT